jgi:hypothetical protein
MRERAITGSVVLGLACLATGFYALVYRSSGRCSIPEGCDTPGGFNPHPYTDYGYALAAVGQIAFALGIALAARRRSAG